MGICSFDECIHPATVKGLCRSHRRHQEQGIELHSLKVFRKRGTGSINDGGYKVVIAHGHPNSWGAGVILEHMLVMSEMLGRPLLPGENIHHKNGVHDDNRKSNLELWVVNQPKGQRPEDLVVWAKEILRLYDLDSTTDT
jgi:hypothetical protein